MNGDQLSLEKTVAAMRRIGVAPEEYVQAYEQGFKGEPAFFSSADADEHMAYQRGYRHGYEARLRGAHGDYCTHPTQVGVACGVGEGEDSVVWYCDACGKDVT